MNIVDAFKNKSILVTGHSGFKGSWLCLWLKELGAHVHGYSLMPEKGQNLYTLLNISDMLTSECMGDIRDSTLLLDYISETKPDYIFHLAAQSLVRRSYLMPVLTFDVNILGSINILESIRQINRACVVIMVTSDKCYQNNEQIWGYRECDPLGGNDPYSASKAAAELVISSYQKSFFNRDYLNDNGIKVATVRAGNVIGGGDWAEDRIIPDAVRSVVSGTNLILRNPEAVRPWQYVLDPLSGYLLLAGKMMFSIDKSISFTSPWNFGPDNNGLLTVKEVVDLFYSEWGKGTTIQDNSKTHPHESGVLTLSCEKSKQFLKWKSIFELKDSIRRTSSWYKDLYNGNNIKNRSLEEIRFATNEIRKLYTNI